MALIIAGFTLTYCFFVLRKAFSNPTKQFDSCHWGKLFENCFLMLTNFRGTPIIGDVPIFEFEWLEVLVPVNMGIDAHPAIKGLTVKIEPFVKFKIYDNCKNTV
jgi:hypothetical protein